MSSEKNIEAPSSDEICKSICSKVESYTNYSIQELQDLIEQTKLQIERTQNENNLILSYISHEDPSTYNQIMNGLAKLPKDISEVQEFSDNFDSFSWLEGSSIKSSIRESSRSPQSKSIMSFSRGSQRSNVTRTTGTSNVVKPREYLSTLIKIEMAEKEISRKEANILRLQKLNENEMQTIKNEEKAIEQCNEEILKRIEEFKKEVLEDGFDPSIGQVTTEAFLRFVRKKQKEDTLTGAKLRLRTAALRQKSKTIQKKINTKKQLGTDLTAVDFELVQIQKKEVTKKLSELNSEYLEVRKNFGKLSQLYNDEKKDLDDKIKLQVDQEKKNLKLQTSIAKMKQENVTIQFKIDELKMKIDGMQVKKKNYRTSSIDEYWMKKQTLMKMKDEQNNGNGS